MNKPLIGIGADIQSPEGSRERVYAYLTYADAVRRAGAIPVLVPPQPENVRDLAAGLDGVLLAGGEDCDPAAYGEERHPNCEPMDVRRQAGDLALAAAARDLGVPTLGICLGLQVMNVAAGGSLIQDIDSEHDTDIRHASEPMDRARHGVLIEKGTRLAELVRELELDVNSSHHQAIRRVGAGLRINALAPDGIVEGIEDARHPFYVGVQWHPEDMTGEESATAIFQAFIAAARERAIGKTLATTSPEKREPAGSPS